MKTQNAQLGAATPGKSTLFGKKDANLKTNNLINFQIGLIAALLFVWLLVELTTEQEHVQHPVATIQMPVTIEPDMGKIVIVPDVPTQVTKQVMPAPPKPVISLAPPKIVVNTTILPEPSTEPVTSPAITLNSAPTTNAVVSNNAVTTPVTPAAPTTVLFSNASEAPLFPGCSAKMTNAERASCFNEKIGKFVQKNFDTGIANDLQENLVKFTVVFTIDEHGDVTDVIVKSKLSAIEKEAKRLMNKLPDMIPGKFNKQAVRVQYALPIVFTIN